MALGIMIWIIAGVLVGLLFGAGAHTMASDRPAIAG